MNRKMIISLTIAVGVISAAATAMFMHFNDETTPQATVAVTQQLPAGNAHPPGKDSAQVMENVMRQIELLRAQVDKLEHQQAATKLTEQTSTAAVETVASQTTEPSLTKEEAAKQREALVKSHKNLLENNLRQEQKDAKWAESAQTKLSSTYSAADAKGVHFLASDCRSTMCKVDIALDSPSKANEIELRKLMNGRAPWRGQRFMQMDKQTGNVVMYMMREKHSLPNLPSETVTN
jgi:hypothetical protein